MRVRVSMAVLGVALVAVVLVPAGRAAAAVRNVGAGQSIQAAVNAASPGDTIKVASGIFRESVEVTKSLTILGAGAGDTILQPPASPPTQTKVCQDPSAPSVLNGFCVHGTIDQNFNVVTPVGAVRVSGFSVKNFGFSGIMFFGATSPQADSNIVANNAEYGAVAFASTNTRMTGNIANKNGEAGLYVGDSPSANAVISGNQATNQSIGIFVRDASGTSTASPGKVTGNLVRGNCVGIFFLNTGSGETHWEASGNQASANNRFCPPSPDDPESVSGIGFAIAGPNDVFVHDNLVTNNVPSQPPDVSGGIIVAEGATNIRVTRNEVKRNQPDLVWDGTGSATFTNNSCQTSNPNGVC